MCLNDVLALARGLPPLSVAVVEAKERFVLESVVEATRAGIIEPILIGNIERISEVAADLPEVMAMPMLSPEPHETVADCGVRLVLEGRAQTLMKGWLHTDELMHAVLKRLRTDRRMSHVFVAELATYPKLLLITDAAINISPDLTAKAAIVNNAVWLARLLGIERPKVAALSAIELVKQTIPSSLDAACLSKMAERGQILHAIVDGPLAFDNAISREAAEMKGIVSQVAGDVDILLVPDLDAGNILAKNLEYLSHATLAGIVLGARVPIILSSRSDPPRARLVSAALANLVWHRSVKVKTTAKQTSLNNETDIAD
ncbi:MAG: bifunctional enoyl-CoA hydratase/phosphate acetyltransferase [Methylobacter sp.]|uniref:Bifunctional enoyl-CoA hydratase/phosphate acetyltransferase n=1 Tax=Candidatus Methylobacter titanis TaxID=3053457 RepID=A0AA43Q1Z1_9GAMM|nr:bifunctional enoyl-CoA hydratase/phosphate acetyltransferase [Candidatus Methylobacter titanis]